MMMISVIQFELPNGSDTYVNEGGVYGDSNNGCGDGNFDDLILSVLIPVCSSLGVKNSLTGFSNRVLFPLGVKFQLPKKIPGPVLM